MPLYEYQCEKCGRFELIQKFSDALLLVCPTCGQPVEKLLSAPAIQFKGTGWYITDYARKGGSGSSGSGEGGKSSEGSKSSESTKSSESSKSSETKSSDSTSSPQTSTSKDSSASGGGSSK